MPIPTDPLLANQWHLSNPVAGLFDLNVFGVWDPFEGPAYTGAGTTTVVIDDGFDYNHYDLAPNYNLGLDFDYDTNTNDAFGNSFDAHGTAVMGIIGAAANGLGTVGIAHETELVGYRVFGFISDAWLQDIRDSISDAAPVANADVVNISQGIANDANSEFGNGYNLLRFDEIRTSIGDAVNLGRGGLGTTIVKSAGNSRSDDYDVNADLWTNDTRQVVVAAVDQDGFVSSYSSYGAAVLVSGFGTPGEVFTTDRLGADGYTGNEFMPFFNGTSSAAPMVSGVVSLMYEANPGLGWRDVQDILGASARHVGTDVGAGTAGSERYAWQVNGAATWNGGGQHHSNDYGYGLVDALAAVRMAETWLSTGAAARTTPNEAQNIMDVLDVATVIPDGDLAGLEFTGTATSDDIVERVTVEIEFDTTYTGDVEVYLTSPDGTESELISLNGDTINFDGTWTFESQAFRGERAAGDWTVRVVDAFNFDVLTVQDIVITTYGADTADDRYIFTDEYSDYAGGAFGHATAIADTNGGIDTVNASTVTTNSTIILNGGPGVVDGVGVTFSGIENAIGGDGHDFIAGNAGNNHLIGMRGNDTLYGNAGFDTLDGRTGNDRLRGYDDDDTIIGGEGNDTLIGNTGDDSLEGGDGLDRAYGGFGNDVINGGLGDDSLEGFDGNDTIDGGADNDFIRGGTGADVLFGGLGNDTIRANNNDDYAEGGDGADIVDGGGGNDLLYGDVGNDLVVGGDGLDTLSGGSGNDTLRGDGGNDLLDGGGGDDLLFGSAGEDTLYGWAGNDLLEGGAQADQLYGSDGNDTLRGGDGFDLLAGGDSNDTLVGGSGNDTLRGDFGADVLRGNANNDTFQFNSILDSTVANSDLIDGIEGVGVAGGDVIDLFFVDADATVAGNQSFVFWGEQTTAQGLSHGAGALWVENSAGQTYVYGIVDNDLNIDLAILVNDGAGIFAADYTSGDFFL